jgi:hypothetical protein
MSCRRLVTFLAALAALAGCASQPPAAPVTPDQVSVHESVSSAPANFRVIKRLWVGSWVSAFGTPNYNTQKEAEDIFRQHAANLGGNGVINFGCYRKSNDDTPLGCNGTVVRFNP